MTNLKYTFKYLEKCNMCNAGKTSFIVLGKRLNSSQGKNPKKKTGLTTTVVKCRQCGLIFPNPIPIPDDIQDHYGVPPNEYWSSELLQINKEYMTGEIDWLNRLIKVNPGMKALDIGAGLGKAMKVLEKNGFDTYGIEPSTTFYDAALEMMKVDRSRIQNLSIEDAEFDNDMFDFISFGAVLEHLYNPSDSIAKAINWVKPNGIIHIEVPNSRWLISRLINFYYKISGMDYVSNISPMHEPYHLYEFSLKSFQQNAKINNYKIADSGYWICNTYAPGIFDFPLRKYMRLTNSGMQLVIWLSK